MADAGETPKKTCFIAMPVRTTEDHAKMFGDEDHWNHVLEELFVPAVEAAGFEAWRPIAKGSHMIHAEIVRQLEQAHMVLVDISHNNPNVFFELGVRTSVDKPIALVRCDASASIPFDVSGVNTHTYNPSLKSFVMDEEREKLTAHLLDAEKSCAGENPIWRQYGLELKATQPTANENPQEAMISLIATKLDNLGSQVSDLRRRTGKPIVYRTGTPHVLTRSDDGQQLLTDIPGVLAYGDFTSPAEVNEVRELDEQILDHAKAHGCLVTTSFNAADRLVSIDVLGLPPEDEQYRSFTSNVASDSLARGFTATFTSTVPGRKRD